MFSLPGGAIPVTKVHITCLTENNMHVMGIDFIFL